MDNDTPELKDDEVVREFAFSIRESLKRAGLLVNNELTELNENLESTITRLSNMDFYGAGMAIAAELYRNGGQKLIQYYRNRHPEVHFMELEVADSPDDPVIVLLRILEKNETLPPRHRMH